MDALKAAGLCALLAAPPQTCTPVVQISNPQVDRWQTLIEAASHRFAVPVEWIRAVMARESGGLTRLEGHPIISRAGAMGLMQLMPNTWSDVRDRYQLGNDPFDPHDNIFAGSAYLREMFDRYGYPDLFAAYHAGPGRLDAALTGFKPLPVATKTYLESIVPGVEAGTSSSGNRSSKTSKPASDLLFFVRANNGKSPSNDTEPPSEPQGLFVPLAPKSDLSRR